jgi:hypothetical protein
LRGDLTFAARLRALRRTPEKHSPAPLSGGLCRLGRNHGRLLDQCKRLYFCLNLGEFHPMSGQKVNACIHQDKQEAGLPFRFVFT